jgi:hypothetical protein
MASRTSYQAWSKGLDAGTYCKYQALKRFQKSDKEFPKSSSAVKVDGHHPNMFYLYVNKNVT